MKTKLSLFAALALAIVNPSSAAESAKPLDDCCKPPLASTAPLSRKSIYQLDAKFTNDGGRAFTLAELRGRPVVLTMFFASCGYACPLLVTDMQALREKLPAEVRAQTTFVLVSFDTLRDQPAELAHYRAQRALDQSWTLLHGNNDAVRELAALLGVKYKRDADGAFSHSNVITILNAEGEIIHQRIGLTGGLDDAARVLAESVQPVHQH